MHEGKQPSLNQLSVIFLASRNEPRASDSQKHCRNVDSIGWNQEQMVRTLLFLACPAFEAKTFQYSDSILFRFSLRDLCRRPAARKCLFWSTSHVLSSTPGSARHEDPEPLDEHSLTSWKNLTSKHPVSFIIVRSAEHTVFVSLRVC